MTEEAEASALVFDFALDAPREKVWRALTEPAFIDRWLMPVAAGDVGSFSGRPDSGTGVVAAEVLDAEPPSRLRWSWSEAGTAPGIVTFTLTPNADGGTDLRLVHERRAMPAMQPAANSNAATMMLAA